VKYQFDYSYMVSIFNLLPRENNYEMLYSIKVLEKADN